MIPVFVEGEGASGGLAQTGPSARPPQPSPTDGANTSRGGSWAAQPPFAPPLVLRHLVREAARVLRVYRVGIWCFEEVGSLVRLVTQNSRREGPIRENQLYPKRLASAF